MQLTRFKCDAQWFAGTKQVLLADYVIKRSWPEAFCKRG
jgi:hypothetical protein